MPEVDGRQAASNPFKGLDRWLENTIGADMRLIYGTAIPMLVVVDLIILLALSPSTWLVGLILVAEFFALALVVYAFLKMLDDDGEDTFARNP